MKRVLNPGSDAGLEPLNLLGQSPALGIRQRAALALRVDELWTQRHTPFFKPASGYGSKAAYRGDKLTRWMWAEILAGDSVAQAIAPPSERLTQVDGAEAGLKPDVRACAHACAIQLVAARLCAGQTTNFRTPGGGFAPVFVVPERVDGTLQNASLQRVVLRD
ncbi:MAG: hypothetical protein Q8K35_00480 [Thiobacillus sp.]|nr:hypothetical protein [Thiobacillus sp.]MDP2056220.1 hypothetical protein [Thiobacillus sp.]